MFITEQTLLVKLLIGHFVADFLTQPKRMIRAKETQRWKSASLYIHAGVYTMIIFVASAAWRQAPWLLPCLFITHVLIDGWKSSRPNKSFAFIVDQIAHLAILIAIFFLLAPSTIEGTKSILAKLWISPRVLCIALAYLVVLWPFGRLINVLTMPFRQQLDDVTSRGLESAGLWIGCLERAFLLSFILFDYLPGAALLLGLKSLFRFGEIRDSKNRKETEYILIGTMLSFGFTIVVGILIKFLMKTLV